jgi:hypothetical protein
VAEAIKAGNILVHKHNKTEKKEIAVRNVAGYTLSN